MAPNYSIQPETAAMLVIRHLRGLPDDPKIDPAETRLIQVILDHAVNVDHARSVLEKIDAHYPSPHELKEALTNVRERFAPPPTQQEQIDKWVAEGATYDPEWTTNFLKQASAATSETFIERHKREHMAIVEEWRKEDPQGRRRLYPPNIAYSQIRERLGFELTPYDKQVLDAWGAR